MREAAVHVPFDTIDKLGFDIATDQPEHPALWDVAMVACSDRASIVAITYAAPADDVLTNADAIEWWKRLDRNESSATYLCRVTAPPCLEPLRDDRDPTIAVVSVTVEDDGCTLTLLGSQHAIRGNLACADGDTPSVSLRRLTDYEGPQDTLAGLTSRQREVLEAAHDRGYYEIPRETTAADLARALDLDRSTVTEHLQRAERTLIGTLLGD